ncbi:phospho-N-acetylmuramoyl-pentapeptide-transferase [bacterium]|jgi:phospho-N-acetylmuramoyl-pentapeptide-transferase|nr:phospho-N-acetylmuramoyl-pentapeptide-transferase [bacterium]
MLKYEAFLILCFIVMYLAIQFLSKKKVYQTVYDLSPETHQKKAKTPSFGGVSVLVMFGVGLFFVPFNTIFIWVYAVILLFGTIGFIDDSDSYLGNKNQGLTAKRKFIYQVIVSGITLCSFHFLFRELSLVEWFIYGFLFIGVPNATNLTDGLDGLLSGLSVISLCGFYVCFLMIRSEPGLHLVFISILVLMSFLVFNWKPAKQYLGDTGSLCIGALLVSFSLLLGNPWILLGLGSVFAIETLSVILQVLWFKRTRTRIFLMAPLHHHYELLGWSEKKVVFVFYAVHACIVVFTVVTTYIL